ncbi:MAG: DUF4837 family protein [Prevotellaceae bacterium]|jgi:hypothetical protein|nr:DUF4837 family protein [Prevotellaceae bacterium]
MKSLRLKIIPLVCLGAFLLTLSACTCSNKDRGKYLSAVSGKAGEVVIVANKALWNSEVGEAFRDVLAVEYPYLPQSEPSFNLVNISADMFSSAFQIHRNLIIVEVGPNYKEARMVSQRDYWASPQIIIKITGPDAESVEALIREQSQRLWTLIDQAEVDRQSTNARKYADRQLKATIKEKFGIELSIPEGYHKNNPLGNPNNFMWFGYDTNFASTGLFIYSYPYKDTAQFSQKALNAKRQELLKDHVPSSREGSYMITNPYVEPEYTPITYKGTFLGRLRGLWEVHNGYMGGPFVSYSMVVNGNMVTVEGYVYAPKTEKRNYLRQVIGILMTAIPEKQENTNTSGEK